MKLDDAMKTALEYEVGVHQAYLDAAEKTKDPAGKRVYKALAEEELGHVKYLQERLEEWHRTGKITLKNLATSIPKREDIDASLQALRKTMKAKPSKQNPEVDLLKKALDAEVKTSAFYKDMVGRLDGDGQKLFRRFVEIEEGHEAIVQAELDSVDGSGVFLSVHEFPLELE